jgi:hypothetical protein
MRVEVMQPNINGLLALNQAREAQALAYGPDYTHPQTNRAPNVFFLVVLAGPRLQARVLTFKQCSLSVDKNGSFTHG